MKLEAKSVLGMDTGKALVEVTIDDFTVMIPAEAARKFGSWIIEASTAAEIDKATFEVLTEIGGLQVNMVAVLLELIAKKRGGE